MPLILASNSASGGYNVANSLRYNSASSDNLSRTPGSAGNRRTYTISYWLKRSKITYNYDMNIGTSYSAGAGNSFQILFDNTDKLNIQAGDGSWQLISTQLFRDVSAWYHIVVAIDTTQATSSNRIKMYVNGSQVTSFSTATYMSQNLDTAWNNTIAHYIGDFNNAYSMNGYMAEVYNIDGQQLTPSSFGQTDPSVPSSGIWQPKAYTGSFGTNGFYLKFANSAALGTDSSGNGNTFTVNNLTSVDQSTDTPTNNFATFNSIKFSGGDLTQGNLELDSTSAGWKTRNSTIGVTTGKWFMEFKMGSISTDESGVCIVPDTVPDGNFPASDATRSPAISYNSDGRKLVNAVSTSAYFSTMSTNDIIGIALDMTGGTVQFYRNGSTTGSPINLSDAFTSSNYPLFFVAAVFNTRDVQANFGSPPYAGGGYTDAAGFGNFSYAVPAGYYSLCTKNLANFG